MMIMNGIFRSIWVKYQYFEHVTVHNKYIYHNKPLLHNCMLSSTWCRKRRSPNNEDWYLKMLLNTSLDSRMVKCRNQAVTWGSLPGGKEMKHPEGLHHQQKKPSYSRVSHYPTLAVTWNLAVKVMSTFLPCSDVYSWFRSSHRFLWSPWS